MQVYIKPVIKIAGEEAELARQLIPTLDIQTSSSTHKYWWGSCQLEDTEEMRRLGPIIAKILEYEYGYKVTYNPESLHLSLKSRLD